MNAAYFAVIGVGSWTSTTSYPVDITNLSCATYSGYIYCVGGTTGSGITDSVYYSGITQQSGVPEFPLWNIAPIALITAMLPLLWLIRAKKWSERS